MPELKVAWESLKFGGAMVYPLLFLGVLAVAIIIDRSVLYARCLRLPAALADLVETFGFSWAELEKMLAELGPRNAYGPFLPDAIPRARRYGTPRLAPCRSHPPRPGRRRSNHRPPPVSGCQMTA